MTRWLMLMKVNPLAVPADPGQAAKLWTAMNDLMKNSLSTGEIQEGGMYADGSGAYALWDDKGDTENDLIRTHGISVGMMPFMTCEVKPVLDVDQARKSIGGA